jgi:formate-dependent nitrite reductase cytochrome c552 subunit
MESKIKGPLPIMWEGMRFPEGTEPHRGGLLVHWIDKTTSLNCATFFTTADKPVPVSCHFCLHPAVYASQSYGKWLLCPTCGFLQSFPASFHAHPLRSI